MTPYPEIRPTELTQISVRVYNVVQLRNFQASLGLRDYDAVLEHLFRQAPSSSGPTAPTPPPLSGRGTYPRCQDSHDEDGRRIGCRRNRGHEGRHRWWSKSGETVEWNHRREGA